MPELSKAKKRELKNNYLFDSAEHDRLNFSGAKYESLSDNRKQLLLRLQRFYAYRHLDVKTRINDFYKNLSVLKTRLPKQLLDRDIRTKAYQKLSLLIDDPMVERVFRDRSTGRPVSPFNPNGHFIDKYVMPQRYDSFSNVLSQLGKASPFAGKEIMLAELPTDECYSDFKQLPPLGVAKSRANSAYILTMEDLRTYNCIVFYDRNSFVEGNESSMPEWGTVSKTAKPLAIQILDSDPNKLLLASKEIARLRSNDPIAIYDLYGKLFYPF